MFHLQQKYQFNLSYLIYFNKFNLQESKIYIIIIIIFIIFKNQNFINFQQKYKMYTSKYI